MGLLFGTGVSGRAADCGECEMTDANKWEHKEEWWKKGKEFLVVVRHHRAVVPEEFNLGPNRWAVYAYIYPDHPLFGNFQGPEMFQPAANSLPSLWPEPFNMALQRRW